jgi:Fe-S-cluster containining protein
LPQFGAPAHGAVCPFQVSNLCSVHSIKPLGCRVYFCDRSAQQWQQELSERSLQEIRAIHDEHGIPYRYGEWRSMLSMFTGH